MVRGTYFRDLKRIARTRPHFFLFVFSYVTDLELLDVKVDSLVVSEMELTHQLETILTHLRRNGTRNTFVANARILFQSMDKV
jgi:hypothetical protein